MLAIVGSLAAGAVTAKPTKSATIEEAPACTFAVTYSYSGLGHGSDLDVHVVLIRQEAGTTNQSMVAFAVEHGFSGNGAAIVTEDFTDSAQTGSFEYIGYGYLVKNGMVIGRSQAYSEPTSAETCG